MPRVRACASVAPRGPRAGCRPGWRRTRMIRRGRLRGRLQALAGRAEAPALQARDLEVRRRVPGLLEPQPGVHALDHLAQLEHRLASLGGRCIAGRWERSFEHCSHRPSRACAAQHRHSPMDSGTNGCPEPSTSVHRDPLRLWCAQTLPRQARGEPIKLFARELEYAGVIARPREATRGHAKPPACKRRVHSHMPTSS